MNAQRHYKREILEKWIPHLELHAAVALLTPEVMANCKCLLFSSRIELPRNILLVHDESRRRYEVLGKGE